MASNIILQKYKIMSRKGNKKRNIITYPHVILISPICHVYFELVSLDMFNFVHSKFDTISISFKCLASFCKIIEFLQIKPKTELQLDK